MIYLAKRLGREETDADKEEFIRGAVGLNRNGEKQAAVGFVAGYLLTSWLRNRG